MRVFERIVIKNEKEALIESRDRVVVGFSGGPDSVFLVEMLLKLKEKINFNIVLVHINHLLRGEEAQRDEDFSINYGKSKKLEVFTKKIDVISLAKKSGISLEEAGREARYSFYAKIMQKTKSNKIVLAHNKDDQIETFIFRLSRGTGLCGLEGILSKRDVYIRPISEIYKSEIIEYLNKNKIAYCIDSTNLKNDFTRNSIRLDLIPFIEQRYNPKFKDKIFSLIEEIREINFFIEEEIKRFQQSDILKVSEILRFPKNIRGRILSKFLYKHGLDINRKKISLIENILEKGGSQEVTLSSEYILKKEYDILKVEKKYLIKESIREICMVIPNRVEYGNYIIEAEYTDRIEQNRDCFYTNLKVGDTLIIRGRKEGDKINPIGMKGEKKLKDIFINEKIAKRDRNFIPLVVHKGNIVWIAGIRGNEKYSSTAKICVKLSVRRIK
ncbi:tRNA lysidine(34) synthetase TilS [Fusobacterium necrogenes]|uniref:tRNA lysidine(34) synthetase TilS n=1 Tax=Fusobacterium necrogenes TaxID=858 RepID=UPI00255C662E|nr:tRNA lysidine(34) synthetase TilS [Fusobacterium necrogenes]